MDVFPSSPSRLVESPDSVTMPANSLCPNSPPPIPLSPFTRARTLKPTVNGYPERHGRNATMPRHCSSFYQTIPTKRKQPSKDELCDPVITSIKRRIGDYPSTLVTQQICTRNIVLSRNSDEQSTDDARVESPAVSNGAALMADPALPAVAPENAYGQLIPLEKLDVSASDNSTAITRQDATGPEKVVHPPQESRPAELQPQPSEDCDEILALANSKATQIELAGQADSQNEAQRSDFVDWANVQNPPNVSDYKDICDTDNEFRAMTGCELEEMETNDEADPRLLLERTQLSTKYALTANNSNNGDNEMLNGAEPVLDKDKRLSHHYKRTLAGMEQPSDDENSSESMSLVDESVSDDYEDMLREEIIRSPASSTGIGYLTDRAATTQLMEKTYERLLSAMTYIKKRQETAINTIKRQRKELAELEDLHVDLMDDVQELKRTIAMVDQTKGRKQGHAEERPFVNPEAEFEADESHRIVEDQFAEEVGDELSETMTGVDRVLPDFLFPEHIRTSSTESAGQGSSYRGDAEVSSVRDPGIHGIDMKQGLPIRLHPRHTRTSSSEDASSTFSGSAQYQTPNTEPVPELSDDGSA